MTRSMLWDNAVEITVGDLSDELTRLEENADRLAHDSSEYRAFCGTMIKFLDHLGHKVGYDEDRDYRSSRPFYRQNAILVKDDTIIIGSAGAMTDRKGAKVKDGWIPIARS